MNQYDFIAVGDTVTDEFIELKDAHVHCKIDTSACELCVRFGDKIPYESVKTIYAVGNAANAAVSATRLGLSSAFVSDVGNDELGTRKLDALKQNGVETEYVRVHDGMQSNHHYVLRYGPERTILILHNKYPYQFPADLPAPRWIYFSSVDDKDMSYHNQILEYLKAHPETKLAFQPGTFQINLGKDALKGFYEHSEVFFCNKEEAQKILGIEEQDIPELLKKMHELGPHIICITDGPNGAYAYDGAEGWFIPMYPDPKPPVDRTGAGDSFSSTFTAALALGHDLPTALSWGPINSMSVVQYIGAQEGLLTREKIEELLKTAPEDYRPKKII